MTLYKSTTDKPMLLKKMYHQTHQNMRGAANYYSRNPQIAPFPAMQCPTLQGCEAEKRTMSIYLLFT
jgi:hypothetical protein